MWIMEGLSRQREREISAGRLLVLQETLRRLPPESQRMALDHCQRIVEGELNAMTQPGKARSHRLDSHGRAPVDLLRRGRVPD